MPSNKPTIRFLIQDRWDRLSDDEKVQHTLTNSELYRQYQSACARLKTLEFTLEKNRKPK